MLQIDLKPSDGVAASGAIQQLKRVASAQPGQMMRP